jgi:predicted RNA-binding Zn ribbon-like protein
MPPGKCVLVATRRHQYRQWRTEGWTGEPFGPPRLDGGRLCLDFANTVGHRATDHPSEFLTSYAVLVALARYTGALTDAEADHLRRLAERQPDAADAVHREALALRDTVYRLFAAVARRQEPALSDIDEVYRVYQKGLEHARIRRHNGGYGWKWTEAADSLDRPLWPVAWSAVELLTSRDLDRIKMCHGDDGASCYWLFLDETKNRIRRWCNMTVCGKGAKARRQAARRRAARAGEE